MIVYPHAFELVLVCAVLQVISELHRPKHKWFTLRPTFVRDLQPRYSFLDYYYLGFDL